MEVCVQRAVYERGNLEDAALLALKVKEGSLSQGM